MRHLFAGLSLAAALAGSAAAQVAGSYTGTTADGNLVGFNVTTDPANGNLAVTTASINVTPLCSDGSAPFTGVFYFLNQDIINRKVSNTGFASYFTTSFSLRFSADGQSATGTVTTVTSVLSPVGADPEKALFCRSARQAMGVSLQPPGVKIRPPANWPVRFGQNGLPAR